MEDAPIVYGILQPGPLVDNGVPYVRPTEIQNDTIVIAEVRRTSPDIANSYHRSTLRTGDLILSIVGTIGKVAAVPPELNGGNITQSSARIRVDPSRAAPLFVKYALKSPQLIEQFDQATLGTGVQRLNLRDVRQMHIPLPASDQQHRIVGAIETHFSRLDVAVASLKRAKANVKRARASVLKAAVEGRLVPTEAALARAEGRTYEPASILLDRILAERQAAWLTTGARGEYKAPITPSIASLPDLPEGWSWVRMGSLALVSGGITKNAGRGQRSLAVPYLRVANVYADDLRLDDISTISVSESELSRLALEPGDLLIVEGNGSADQLGRVAIWNGAISPCIHQNHLIKARPSPNASGRWILHWLLSPVGRKAIQSVASSTSGLHTLSISKVQSLAVAVPPLAEQHRIVAEVDRRLSVLDSLDTMLNTSLARCTRLRQAVLQRAFEGRLVPAAAPGNAPQENQG